MRILLILQLIFLLGFNLPVDGTSTDTHSFALENFRRLPVQHAGRVKPMDTVARNSLLLLHGSQSLQHQGKSLNAIEWLIDVAMNANHAKTIKLIRVENPDLLAMIGGKQKSRVYYSITDLEPHFKDIYDQSSQALKIEGNRRDSFQQAVVVLWEQIATFLSLSNTVWIAGIENVNQELEAYEQEIIGKSSTNRLDWFTQRYQYLSEAAYFSVLYPRNNDPDPTKWFNMGEGLLTERNETGFHPGIKAYTRMVSSFQQNDAWRFNSSLTEYMRLINSNFPGLSFKMNFEVVFNHFQPFFVSAVIYLLVFIFAAISWIVWPKRLIKIAVFLLITGFVIHTLGLAARMFIEGRPPVTNLYSSAIFVGWGTVLFSLILEKIFRNSIGCVVGATVGSLTLIIAHHLTGSGDTMEMMRAVLDSNFWLSTHVVTITLGYSSTFLAGGLGSIFIVRGLLTKSLDKETSRNLSKMVYGTVCFSTLLCFVGTILGAIWADQSWGRFWGWDPKENGALMIILWNALILHAKIGGFVKRQGLMVMVVVGNIITSLSWFGVNMLGVGLHSYGFMDRAFLSLGIFILIQFVIIALGSLPKLYWRSRTCL